jgi:hypothetical protein
MLSATIATPSPKTGTSGDTPSCQGGGIGLLLVLVIAFGIDVGLVAIFLVVALGLAT